MMLEPLISIARKINIIELEINKWFHSFFNVSTNAASDAVRVRTQREVYIKTDID